MAVTPTRLGRNVIILVVVAALGSGGYFAAKKTGLLDKKEPQATVDVQPSVSDDVPPPPSPQVAQPEFVQSPQQSEQPVQQVPPPVTAQQTDPSANRGMQYLLKQGNQQ